MRRQALSCAPKEGQGIPAGEDMHRSKGKSCCRYGCLRVWEQTPKSRVLSWSMAGTFIHPLLLELDKGSAL